jgi:hypothetical protein
MVTANISMEECRLGFGYVALVGANLESSDSAVIRLM